MILCLLLSSYSGFSQVGINTTSPHTSSALDINSTAKGLLIPRIDSAARVGMTGMANSLLVYDTSKRLFFYYQERDAKWYALNAWQAAIIENGGNTDTITTTFSNVGIGTKTPAKRLDVIGDVKVSDSVYVGTSVKAGASVSAPKIYGEGTTPVGGIIMWSGTIANIPLGWALCDGNIPPNQTVATPNLSGRFIVGYQSTIADYNATNKTGGVQTNIIDPAELPVTSPWVLQQTPHSHKGQHAVVAWQPDNTGQWADNIGDGGSPDWRATTLNTQLVADANANISLQNNTGGGQPVENRPPYYVLAYIIKLNY